MSSTIMNINLDFNIDDLKCCVCLECIQTVNDYRECAACNNAICFQCTLNLASIKCPTCRSKKGFVKNAFLTKYIFPKISKKCIYSGCDTMSVIGSAHIESCIHRTIKCPVCNKSVSPVTLHTHIVQCSLEWDVREIDTIKTITTDMYESKEPMGAFINLTKCGSELKDNYPHNRFVYFWTVDSIILNVFSYQLKNTSDATIAVMMTSENCKDDLRKIGLTVYSKVNAHDIKIKQILLSECDNYDKIKVGLGIHSFKIGDVHSVHVEDDGWNISQVVELASSPMRVIFVTMDPRRMIIAVNLDSPDSAEKIRPAPPPRSRSRSSDSVRSRDAGAAELIRMLSAVAGGAVGNNVEIESFNVI